MKTTETRSYLSRLIWATNGWKRPQYGNPDTKPVWWPNELLNWAEMKKMGGKKADGLSNVNYNEIQKTILHEVFNFRMKLSKLLDKKWMAIPNPWYTVNNSSKSYQIPSQNLLHNLPSEVIRTLPI